jgi:NAD(P)-dependent dehydrogenase (short-subunit alcohol dehydrogenase family)
MRSILITGSSSGIGYAAAHALAQRGWHVYATCRKAEDCVRLESEGLRSCVLDYEDEESVEEAFRHVVGETGGKLDAIFHNGAYCIPGTVEDMPTQALRQIFEANFFGWHHLTRLALPVMRKQGSGYIVCNSSIGGFLALRYRGAYIATKFALEGLMDTLRLELAGTSIHVVLLEPGPIRTQLRRNSYPHFKKWIDWKGSPHRKAYETLVIPRLEAQSVKTPFELPPAAVVAKLIRALEAGNPRPRYLVTTPTHIAAALKRVLSTRLMDRVVTSSWN